MTDGGKPMALLTYHSEQGKAEELFAAKIRNALAQSDDDYLGRAWDARYTQLQVAKWEALIQTEIITFGRVLHRAKMLLTMTTPGGALAASSLSTTFRLRTPKKRI